MTYGTFCEVRKAIGRNWVPKERNLLRIRVFSHPWGIPSRLTTPECNAVVPQVVTHS